MKSNRTVLKDQYYKKVIDLYTKEHLSMWQISKIIPLDRSTIWRWISTFAAYDQESCVMEKKEIETPDSLEQPDDAEPMPDDVESLQAEVKRLRRELTKAVDFYNNKRPHMSINMMTQAQAALCEGEIKKWWISYRERAIKRNQCLENPENPLPLQPALVAYESNQPQVNL